MEKFLSQPSRSKDQQGRFAYLEFSVMAGISNILTKALIIYNFVQGVEVSGEKKVTFRFGNSTFPNYLLEKESFIEVTMFCVGVSMWKSDGQVYFLLCRLESPLLRCKMTNSFSLSLLLTLGDEISVLFAYAHNHTLAQR